MMSYAGTGGTTTKCTPRELGIFCITGTACAYALGGIVLSGMLAHDAYDRCMSRMSNATPAHHQHYCSLQSGNTFGLALGVIYGTALVLTAAVGTVRCIARKWTVIRQRDAYSEVA